jgi:hypothetical protein
LATPIRTRRSLGILDSACSVFQLDERFLGILVI